MSVYLHKKSRYWQYDFQVRGARYSGSTGCTSKSAAKEHVRKLRNEIAEGKQTKPDMTFDEACGNYMDLVGQHERKQATTDGQIRKLTSFFGKSTLIRDLDRTEVNKFVAKRRGEKARNLKTLVSNATVNREVQLLKRIISRVPDDYAKPEINWRGVMLKEAKERVRELSADEEARLFDKLPPDLANVIEFAILSGQRRESIVTMLWSKVDFEGQRATVRVKGDKWHTFPLTPRMIALLKSQPKVTAQVFTYVCERPSPPRNDRPRRVKGERYPFSSGGWARKWQAALKAAGVEDFRFHDLRHTAGTRVLRASKNIKAVQNLLGHTDIGTTGRYAHALEHDVRDAMLATDSRNSPGPTIIDLPENGGNARSRG